MTKPKALISGVAEQDGFCCIEIMNKQKKNILLIGGSGFIGSHLAEKLCKHHNVTMFGRKGFSRENIKSFSSNGKILALAFSPDSKCVTSGSATGTIQTNSILTGKPKIASEQGVGPVTSITYFDKQRDFVTGGADGKLRFWSSGGKECIHLTEAHALPVTTLSAADNGLFFISAAFLSIFFSTL